jgi:ribonuclease Z
VSIQRVRIARALFFAAALSVAAATRALAQQEDPSRGGELTTPLGDIAITPQIAERQPITEINRPRSYYLAGSEKLGADEMRIIALGTGNPQIQRGQASSCFFVELGNGDAFIFDIGMGCTANMAKLEIPWDRFTKVFISHLHFDHFGDLPALVAGGWQMGRSIPIEVWGPSGKTPDLGTRAAMGHMMGMLKWEYVSKRGRAPMSSYAVNVHEFDYSRPAVVYRRNGVTIRAFPAVHTMDGPVSYSLEWNGLKMSYSGDTTPTKWFINNAAASDIVIHECSDPVDVLIKSRNFPPASAWMINTTSHTLPEVAGRIFSQLKPRMAVCFHYVNNGIDARERLAAAVRRTYPGPLNIAQDMMIWNVTPRAITTRMVVGGDYVSNLPRGKEPADADKVVYPSAWLNAGRLDMSDVYQSVLDNLDPKSRTEILSKVPPAMLPAKK